MRDSTSVPSALALVRCLHRMTRFSWATFTEVATTTTTKVEMGMKMLKMYIFTA